MIFTGITITMEIIMMGIMNIIMTIIRIITIIGITLRIIIIIKIGTVITITTAMTTTTAQLTITATTMTVDQEVTITVAGDVTPEVEDGIESCPKSDDIWHLFYCKVW
jgi:hypothetical protein